MFLQKSLGCVHQSWLLVSLVGTKCQFTRMKMVQNTLMQISSANVVGTERDKANRWM